LQSLRAKFLALIVPLILISTAVVFGISEMTARNKADARLNDKVNELVEIQSSVLSEALWNVANRQIELILAAVAIDPDVLGAIVYDELDQPISSIGSIEAIEHQEFFAKKDIVHVSNDEPEIIGRLEIALTDARMLAESTARLYIAAGLAALLLLLVIATALVANRRTIGVPLERLLASINRSREMGERVHVNWKSQDEIGEVVLAFNEMQVRQQADEVALQHAHDALGVRNRELKDSIENLRRTTSIKQRMETELNVGREIQMSMVPLTFPAFPDREEFSIHGSLEPAREIGGDFYDFFFVDDDRLCFCIGDVSGKGVPAALFMAVTKTLIKSRAADDASTASILTHVNDELSQDNPNGMFVTLFIVILNIRSGEFDYTNAGHHPPFLVRADGSTEALTERHGPVIGAVDGMFYRSGRDVLRPGDLLHMYTDGVTEEMDADGQLFSDERLATFVNTHTFDSARTAVDDTVSVVRSFRGDKEPEDDVTVLTIQFQGAQVKGSAEGLHVIVKNELSEITTVQERFREYGEARRFPKDLGRKLDMIFDELLSNIIWYAFPDGGDHEIEVTAEQSGNRLTITVADDGIPFNPLLKDPPDTSLSAEDRQIGGLGIHLVRSMTNDLMYQRHINKNALTLIIHVGPSDDGS
jgi:sigma-B regulation protein RsbU (phosphoserine phosphatase)